MSARPVAKADRPAHISVEADVGWASVDIGMDEIGTQEMLDELKRRGTISQAELHEALGLDSIGNLDRLYYATRGDIWTVETRDRIRELLALVVGRIA